jgi:serine protease AprX
MAELLLLRGPDTNLEGSLVKVFGKAVWGAMIALALCAPAAAAPHPDRAGGSSHKLDDKLRQTDTGILQQNVIITVKADAKAGVRKRLANHGIAVKKDHGIVNAMTVSVTAAGLAALAADPDVEHISADADVDASESPNKSSSTTDTVSNLQKMLAIGNWFTGGTMTVAVIDSGIADTADFSGRILGTYDFTTAGVSTSPAAEYGHGTHVAGLIGSSGVSSGGVYGGVAPGVKFLSLRVLDKKGSGKTSGVIAALEFAVANRSRFNIKVINLSLGHPIYESATTDPLVQAVEAAVRSGIVVVTAAGNFGTNPVTGKVGYAGLTSPGNAPSAITVGAATNNGTIERADDRVAPFSSRGPSWFDGYGKPDIVAPGTGLVSDVNSGSTLALTYPSLVYSTSSGGKLMKLSGSSMATGVVTGLITAMIEAHDYAAQQRYTSSGKLKKLAPYVPPPALTPNAIKAMLQYSATPLRDENGVKYDVLTQGAGEVDGLAAITLAYLADTAQPTGLAWMTAVTPATQFGTELATWSQSVVWGTRVVTGAGLMEVNQSAWGSAMMWGSGELDNIVWGTFAAEGDNIVWGTSLALTDVVWTGNVLEQDNIVWGTSLATWGPNIVWGTSIGVFEGDNIVWGTMSAECDNIVWGTLTDGEGDNIVWGTVEFDNIVWGTSKVLGLVLSGGIQ